MKQAGVYTILNLVTGRCYVRAALVAKQADVESYRQLREKLSASMSGSHRGVPWSALRRARWNAKQIA
jgi:hypothetical protein